MYTFLLNSMFYLEHAPQQPSKKKLSLDWLGCLYRLGLTRESFSSSMSKVLSSIINGMSSRSPSSSSDDTLYQKGLK